MQLTKFPNDAQFEEILQTLHPSRIERYRPASGGNIHEAFRLYQWNCLLCEAFHGPLHYAEIATRNAIHTRLLDRLGEEWYQNETLRKQLGEFWTDQLDRKVEGQREQHGPATSCHHIVSALPLGFWLNLLTKRFDRFLGWGNIREAFPNAPRAFSRQDIYEKVDTIRQWRNRIAHHQAIFDKSPMRHYQDTLMLIRWSSHELADWVTHTSHVAQAIDLRPVFAA